MKAFRDRLQQFPPIVLDGGLATTLESHGHDLDDPLWSARLLIENPGAITRVHREFLTAGADVITTASYQASLTGFGVRGLSEAEGERLLRLSVDLAVAARDEFWADPANRADRRCPLVAASIGPYAAYLADGSEYHGRYDLNEADLRAFHEPRWRILADTPADVLACETLPSGREASVLMALLRETPSRDAWLSFCCRDHECLSHGSALSDVVRDLDAAPQVVAVGINCTAPQHIAALIAEARRGTSKPVLVYPNRGEQYDGVNKEWQTGDPAVDWSAAAAEWSDLGAAGIGGCCRIGPREIAEVRRALGGERR